MKRIAEALNAAGVTWAVGGSMLLKWHGLSERANDLDLVVAEEDAERAHEALLAIGTGERGTAKEPYRTRYFYVHEADGTSIDVMGGFRIAHESGVYEFPFGEASISGREPVPLCALEDWYVLYQLMAGKADKLAAMETHFALKGVARPELLRQALERELPDRVRVKVEGLLSDGVLLTKFKQY